MKLKELDCVFDESEFWFRPEVLNPNPLNLGDILRVFDVLKYLFFELILDQLLNNFQNMCININECIIFITVSFSTSVSKLGHPKWGQNT